MSAKDYQAAYRGKTILITGGAKSLIGYQPNTPFPEGLKNAIAWFQDNWDLIAAAARFGPGMSSAVRNLVCKG